MHVKGIKHLTNLTNTNQTRLHQWHIVTIWRVLGAAFVKVAAEAKAQSFLFTYTVDVVGAQRLHNC